MSNGCVTIAHHARRRSNNHRGPSLQHPAMEDMSQASQESSTKKNAEEKYPCLQAMAYLDWLDKHRDGKDESQDTDPQVTEIKKIDEDEKNEGESPDPDGESEAAMTVVSWASRRPRNERFRRLDQKWNGVFLESLPGKRSVCKLARLELFQLTCKHA